MLPLEGGNCNSEQNTISIGFRHERRIFDHGEAELLLELQVLDGSWSQEKKYT